MDFKRRKKKDLNSESLLKKYDICKTELAAKFDHVINNIFKKSFSISNHEKYKLPSPESLFVESSWQIEDLQVLKNELNDTKSKLNNFNYTNWHQHTSNRNRAKDIEWRIRRDFDPEFVTQAWCKFHEIISKYPMVPKEHIFVHNNRLLSLHLCEAPGAFITCLNHWLKTNTPSIIWDWLAMTYNPYYEGNTNTTMISDDRFIMHTLKNWYFGIDFTGNLMSIPNLDSLIEKCKQRGKVNLITADGSINCINNPGEQEKIVAPLHFCEVVAALHILEKGGNFLLKIFTIFEHETICLTYFLTCMFKKIHFYKPVTSREGNSEIYIVCLEFKGSEAVEPYFSVLRNNYGQDFDLAMFKKDDIPENFMEQIISCAKFFKNHQCEVIENNILTYNSYEKNYSYIEEKKIAKLVADKFMTVFPIKKLHSDLQIVGNLNLKKNKINHWIASTPYESFNEIKEKQILEPVQRLLFYQQEFKFLEQEKKNFVFKSDQFISKIDVCITTGKPYKRVLSSRFCLVKVAEIYKLLFQAVDIEKNFNLMMPTKTKIEKYEQEALIQNYPVKIIHFYYTDLCNNTFTIKKIQECLSNFQKGNELVLLGYLLLSQFNVGLIYLISNLFEKVEFSINDDIGCCITFKNFNANQIILEKLQLIHQNALTAESVGDTILSVIFVPELYDSELYSIIEKLNSWIAKFAIDYISSIYKK